MLKDRHTYKNFKGESVSIIGATKKHEDFVYSLQGDWYVRETGKLLNYNPKTGEHTPHGQQIMRDIDMSIVPEPMDQPELITREEHLAGKSTHHEYYAQFVTRGAISRVLRFIGKDKIEASTDPHMNDIPLAMWDHLNMAEVINRDLWRSANGHENKSTYPWSKSDNVCIAKTAARVWLQNRK